LKRLAAALFLCLTLAWSQEHAAEQHEDPLYVWKWVNFAILAGLLGFLAVKAGGPALRDRAAGISKDLEESRRIRAEAEARAVAIEKRISNLGDEINAFRADAKKEMESEAARIEDETKRTIAKMQGHARQEIESLAKHAENQLRDYAAQLSLKLAEDRVRSRMNPETQTALVNRFVADLGSAQGRSNN
jgi:F-type H+-transporting ATPase subunit b